MAAIIKRTFVSQVFSATGQKAAVEYCGNNYLVTVNSMLVSGTPEGVTSQRGCLVADTSFVFEAAHNSAIKITNQKTSTINSNLFKAKEFSFEKLGIGGRTSSSRTSFVAPSPAECSRNPWFSASASSTSRACCCTDLPARVRRSSRARSARCSTARSRRSSTAPR